MREIEIKAKVADKTPTLQSIANLGIDLGPAKKQHDVVFGPPGFAPGSNWLRIRTEDDKTVYFTLKRSVTGELDSIEHEVVVDDATELERIIVMLGFELFSDLEKTRRKAKYGDIEICFDEVTGLGTFVEAEVLLDYETDYDAAVARLWELFEKLGISRDSQVTNGYDVLMRQQKGEKAHG